MKLEFLKQLPTVKKKDESWEKLQIFLHSNARFAQVFDTDCKPQSVYKKLHRVIMRENLPVQVVTNQGQVFLVRCTIVKVAAER